MHHIISNELVDSQPSVTLLLRNPFGRHVWTSQLRHLPRNKCGFHSLNNNPGRPLPMNDVDIRSDFEPQYFPDSVDRARPCLAYVLIALVSLL